MASMLFQAGLIPTYIIMTTFLGLGDTVWALILPLLLSPFNIILMRTFFKRTISESIIESAKIDGASETRIFFQICLPLSLPGIATITLFTALAYWNDWFNALLYISSYGHGGFSDRANCLCLSILPTLFCEGVDNRWCKRIVPNSIEKYFISMENFKVIYKCK